MEKLISLLGEDNIEELKKKLVELIIEQARSDLQDYNDYLLYPPDMSGIIKDAMESTEKKISKMYKDAVIEINQGYIDKMKDYMLHQTEEPALRSKIYDYAEQLKWRGNEYSKEHKIAEELMKILEETELENNEVDNNESNV